MFAMALDDELRAAPAPAQLRGCAQAAGAEEAQVDVFRVYVLNTHAGSALVPDAEWKVQGPDPLGFATASVE